MLKRRVFVVPTTRWQQSMFLLLLFFSSSLVLSSSSSSSLSSSSSSLSSSSIEGNASCATVNSTVEALFRCTAENFFAVVTPYGDRLNLSCLSSNSILVIRSVQWNWVSAEDGVNSTAKTSCDAFCLSSWLEALCQGKRKCSTKVTSDQFPEATDPRCNPPEDAKGQLIVAYGCVTDQWMKQMESSSDCDLLSNEDKISTSLSISSHEEPGATTAANASSGGPRGGSGTERAPRARRQTKVAGDALVPGVTQLRSFVRKRSDNDHRVNIEDNSGTFTSKPSVMLPTPTVLFATTAGFGTNRWYGNMTEWIWAWRFIQERREKFLLYMILAVLFGVMTILLVLIIRLTQRRRYHHPPNQLNISVGPSSKSDHSAPLTARNSPVAWQTPDSDQSVSGADSSNRSGVVGQRRPVELTSFNRVGSLPGLDCSTPPPPPLMPVARAAPPPRTPPSPEHEEYRPASFVRESNGIFIGGGCSSTDFVQELPRDYPKPIRDFPDPLIRGGIVGGGGGYYKDSAPPQCESMRTSRNDLHGLLSSDVRRNVRIQKDPLPPPPLGRRTDLGGRDFRTEFRRELSGDFTRDFHIRRDFTPEFRYPIVSSTAAGTATISRGVPTSSRPLTATINRGSLCGQLNTVAGGQRFGGAGLGGRSPFIPDEPPPVAAASFTLPGERLFSARRHRSLQAGLDFDGDDGEFGGRRSLQQSPCGRDYLIEMELMECLKTLQPVIRQYSTHEAGFATS